MPRPWGVSGELADTMGYEHTAVSWDGTPLEPYTLRVTHVCRREDGEWRIVHRHADAPRINQTAPADASTE
jgi:ketosteroid isomerase-like protein